MVAAARKHGRVVQVGTQRKSTPHLVEAKKNIVDSRDAGQGRPRRHLLLLSTCGPTATRRLAAVPDFFDYEMWTGPAPLRPYDGLPHVRWWRTFMEYGNGIVGDMCVHMLDTVRWMLGLGWPKRVSSTGGIFVQTGGKSNISDTQTAMFEYPRPQRHLAASHLGRRPDPKYPWALTLYRRQGNAEGQHR